MEVSKRVHKNNLLGIPGFGREKKKKSEDKESFNTSTMYYNIIKMSYTC